MTPSALRATLALASTVALALPVGGQIVPPTPEQQAAGDRVVGVEFDVDALVVEREQAMSVSVRLLDASGNQVDGANVLLAAESGVTPQYLQLTSGGPAEFRGTVPSEGTLQVLVFTSSRANSALGLQGALDVGSVPVRVLDWPAAEIELQEPPYTAYVGTSLRFSGSVLTDRGTDHASAVITWRTSDAQVARITDGGIFTGLNPGRVIATAHTENEVVSELEVDVVANPVARLSVTPITSQVRTGDVVQFDVRPVDAGDEAVTDAAVALSVSGLDGTGGFVFEDGTFVAEEPGAYRVLASVGSVSASAVVEVVARGVSAAVELVDHGALSHVTTSDVWVFEGRDGRDYAYTGTWLRGGGRMFVWDVSDPADVLLVDSVTVDARVVNDVKVNKDATWAIITREGASTRRDGIVVLDLEDPAHPTIIAELTDSLTGGIHNVWIMDDIVYAVNNGTSAMNIIDMSDPKSPRNVGRWELRPGDTDKTLHDVWAKDGYAYLSYWNDGLVILDVGAGTHGGTPVEPAFVSQIAYPEGNTHVAWRDRDYVFVGDEITTRDGMRGFLHVIDVSDLENPREVAKYDLPEAGAHNVWVEDEVLYIAYYQGGVRVVDVSGTLRGDLYRQGREIGFLRTGAGPGEAIQPNSPQAWGPQVHKGHLFVSDNYSGLWVVKHDPPVGAPIL
jgi:hypothetical protein